MRWPPEDLTAVARLLLPSGADASAVSWVAVLLSCLYLTAYARRRRNRLPPWRAAAFLLGCALLWAFTGTGLERYARLLLSGLMLQQLTLMILVPSLLVLGAPGVLLRTTSLRSPAAKTVRRALLRASRGRLAQAALHPAIGIGLFLFAYYGLYLTSLTSKILQVPAGDLLLEVFFLGTGLLFAIPIFSRGPLPRRISHPERAIDVFIEIGLHAFFGVLVMVSTTALVPALATTTAALGIDPLEDQRLAGGLAWSYGEAPAALTLLYVMERWFRSDAQADRRASEGSSAATTSEHDDYNAYLNRLAQHERPSSPT